jgi:hypothetical protein
LPRSGRRPRLEFEEARDRFTDDEFEDDEDDDLDGEGFVD